LKQEISNAAFCQAAPASSCCGTVQVRDGTPVELASALTRLVWTIFSNWSSVEKHLELQWLLLVDLLDNMIMPRSENVASFFSSCNFPMFSQLAFRNRLLKHTLFHCFSQSLEARSVALPNSWHFLSAIFAPVSILRRSGDVV